MFKFLRVRRQNDRSATQRPRLCRRPLVEALEGRQLLSDIVGQHIGSNAAAVQGAHIGTNVAAIQGAHIGTNVAAVQGAHIGMAELGGGGVGQHIG
jgi:hypothetical protein